MTTTDGEERYRCVGCYDEKPRVDMLPTDQCQCRYPTVCWDCFRAHVECGLKSNRESRRIPNRCWTCHTLYCNLGQLFLDAGIVDVSVPPFMNPLYRIEGVLVWTLSACLAVGLFALLIHYWISEICVDLPELQRVARLAVTILLALYVWRYISELRDRTDAARRGIIQVTMLPDTIRSLWDPYYWPPTMLVVTQLLLISGAPPLLSYLALFVSCFDWETPELQNLGKVPGGERRDIFWLTLVAYALSYRWMLFMQLGGLEPWWLIPNMLTAIALATTAIWLGCNLLPLAFYRFLYKDPRCLECDRDNDDNPNALADRRAEAAGFGYACDRLAHYPDLWEGIHISFLALFTALLFPMCLFFLPHTEAIHAIAHVYIILTVWPAYHLPFHRFRRAAAIVYGRLEFYWRPSRVPTSKDQYRAFLQFMECGQRKIGRHFDPSKRNVILYRSDPPKPQ